MKGKIEQRCPSCCKNKLNSDKELRIANCATNTNQISLNFLKELWGGGSNLVQGGNLATH